MKGRRAARAVGGRARTLSPSGRRGAAVDPRWWWRLGLFALFGLATAWRWAYLARLRQTPFAGSLDADSMIYWQWSESILRHGPMPPSPFFLAPLYPYALALVRAAGAASIGQVLAVQALLGAGATVLLADATSRLSGWRTALVVGGLLALFQPTTFFDGLVLPESLLFFVESLTVWLVARTDWSLAGISRYAAYGVLAGLLALGRASHAVLLALVLPLAWTPNTRPARRLAAAAAAVLAFAICCLPATLANWRTSGEPIPFTYNLGFNLYVGNNPEADGGWIDVTKGSLPVPLAGTSPTTGGALDGRAFLLATEGLELSPARSSAHWAGKALAFIRAAPRAALGLWGKKLLLVWNRREIPQIESMDSFARAAGPLGIPLAGTFGFLAILGLSGVPWAVRRGPAERWLAGYVALVALAMVPFFVTDRYRLHLVPSLAVLGGLSIAATARAARSRTVSEWLHPAVAVGLAAAIVLVPIGTRRAESRDWTFLVDRAIRSLDRGAYAEAAEAFARAEAALGEVRGEALSTSARTDLASFYFRYAIALETLGRHDEAIARWERAVALNPNDAGSLGRLSVAYELSGRTSDAAVARRRLISVPGGRGQLLLADGWSAAGRGDLALAESRFVAAIQAAPDLSLAWAGLVRLRIQTGRFEEAQHALDQARGAGLDPLTADIDECFLAARRGDLARARRILARIPSESAPADPFLASLLESSRRALAAAAGR
jgi:Flp pilus assembly protein TadD